MGIKPIRVKSKLSQINALINLPASKSISNRVLILKEIYELKTNQPVILKNLSEAEDTQILRHALNNDLSEINIQNAGTCLRFLTAYFSAKPGSNIIISGNERMKDRPIIALVNALIQLGANIEYLESKNCLPIRIKGRQLNGGIISIDSHQSSQFVSALMLISPLLSSKLRINLVGEVVSKDYILLTQTLLKEFGFSCEISSDFKWVQTEIQVETKHIETYKIESDWSSAAFFYQAALLADEANIYLENLNLNSIQGDSIIAKWMNDFGIKSIQEGDNVKLIKSKIQNPSIKNISFINHPDLAPTFICATAGAYISFCAEGIYSLTFKESNRIMALEEGLKKLHFRVISDENSLCHDGLAHSFYQNEVIQTYSDHRICMSFAILSIMLSEIILSETESVIKSFPNFWMEMKKIGIVIG